MRLFDRYFRKPIDLVVHSSMAMVLCGVASLALAKFLDAPSEELASGFFIAAVIISFIPLTAAIPYLLYEKVTRKKCRR